MAYNSTLPTPKIEGALLASLKTKKIEYNITQDKSSNYASLAEAIAAVDDDEYKVKGIVLTFYTGTDWVSKRYNGEDASGFANEGNWIDVGGVGSSTHTLDLSPLFDEEGSPVATVSDEFLVELQKAYDEKYSNTVFMGVVIPMSVSYAENIYSIDLILTADLQGGKWSLAAYRLSINDNDKSLSFGISALQAEINGSGTKALTDNGQYAEFAKPTKVESGGSGTVTKQINPNTFYKFGEVSSLTITLAAEESGIENEYKFEFVSGTTATTLSLPETVKWSGGNAPTIEASKTYQVSIVNNLAVFAAF